MKQLSKFLLGAIPAVVLFSGMAHAQTITGITVKQLNTPDSRPCLFLLTSNNLWYAMPRTRTADYAEVRLFLLTAYAMKAPITLNLVPGSNVCNGFSEIATVILQ
jgi:hypothetical protein